MAFVNCDEFRYIDDRSQENVGYNLIIMRQAACLVLIMLHVLVARQWFRSQIQ